MCVPLENRTCTIITQLYECLRALPCQMSECCRGPDNCEAHDLTLVEGLPPSAIIGILQSDIVISASEILGELTVPLPERLIRIRYLGGHLLRGAILHGIPRVNWHYHLRWTLRDMLSSRCADKTPYASSKLLAISLRCKCASRTFRSLMPNSNLSRTSGGILVRRIGPR